MSSADVSNMPKSLAAHTAPVAPWLFARSRSLKLRQSWEERLHALQGAYSDDSIRGYRSAFRQFSSWCKARRLKALPASPATLVRYIGEQMERYAPATIRHRLCAVTRMHRLFELGNPVATDEVRLALRRMHRRNGQRQRQPLGMRASLRDVLAAAAPSDLRGARNRAVLAVGYDTLCRRSELVTLSVEDLARLPGGAGSILIRRSKSDPLGSGRQAYLSPRTMAALEHWLELSGIKNGPLFRAVYGKCVQGGKLNSYTITRIVKELAQNAGLSHDTIARISGHSFRIGAALDMIEHGIALVPVLHAGGWKSAEMVVRYTQQIDVTKSGVAQLYRDK